MPEVTIPDWTQGWRLRRALAHADIGVSEMAQKLDYSRQSLTKWLRDDPRVHVNRVLLEKFAAECGVPFEWLLTGDEKCAIRDSNPEPTDPAIEPGRPLTRRDLALAA